MGHVNVFACCPDTLETFVYHDGGSNGYDREDHFQKVIQFTSVDVAQKKRNLSELWESLDQ